MSCPVGDSDAAYVLGSLDPAEARAFERHLEDCERCRCAVSELRSLPGLLSRLLPEAAAAQPEPVMPDLMPGLAVRIRRIRRVARLRVAGLVAATALVAAAAGAAVASGGSTDLPAAEPAATEIVMSAQPGVPVRGTLFVRERGWGTSVDTRCRYPDSTPAADGPVEDPDGDASYSLFTVDRSGRAQQVSSWSYPGGPELDIPGSTALDLTDIVRFEIRDETGVTVLVATL